MDLQEPLLSEIRQGRSTCGDWPSEAAEKSKLYIPPSWPGTHHFDATCVITYDAEDKLLYIKSDGEDERFLDAIDPRDIIGANLEIKLFGPSEALSHVGFRNAKARSPDADSNDSLVEDEPSDDSVKETKCDIFKPLGRDMEKLFAFDNADADDIPFDTQATAVLNIYCYPRKHPSQDTWGNWFGLASFKAEPNPRPPPEVDNMGHRYAHHRRFEVVRSEDFADIRTLVRAIRSVAGLGHCVDNIKTSRYLVFVNPAGGQKKAKSIYDTVVEPMLEQACVDHDLLVTTHARHAEEYMVNFDVDRYDGFVVVGGDGVIHEALQGIRKRPDSEAVLKRLKLGVVGGGTSNGLAKSILHESKELYSSLESTFMICKGQTCSLDLSEYKTKDNSYTSFLTFSYAMIADIDVDSEVLRCLGTLRLDLWGAYLGLRLRSYAARVSYLPLSQENSSVEMPDLNDPVPSNWTTFEDDIVLLWVSQVSHASSHLMSSPPSTLKSGVFHITLIR